jgi:glutamate:GABA antiporter
MQRPTLFTRKATGLVRSVSPTTMLLANMGEIAFGTGILTLNFYNGFYLGGNAALTVLIFALIGMFEAYIYFHIIRSVGRTGGDYVWISRNLGPVAGGLLTLGFVFTGLPFIAISLNWLWTLSLGPSASAIGAVSTSGAGVVSAISSVMGSPAELLAISLVILIIVMAVNVFSPRHGYFLLSSFVVIALIGTLMMAGVYIGLGSSGIQSAVSNFLTGHGSSYGAVSSLYSGSSLDLGATLLLLPAAAYIMPWINNASAFSGELKNLKKQSWMSTFVPILISGLLVAFFLQLYYSTLGFNFAMGSTTLTKGLANTFVFPNMLTIATIAMGNNAAFIWIMNITFAFWYLASLQQTILAISRYALGMSLDRLIPVQLSKVSDKFHSPIASLGLTFIAAIPMIVIASYYNWLTIFSTIALAMVFFAFIGITAIVYGWRKKPELRGSSSALMVSGAIVAVFFAYVSYLVLTDAVYGINNLSWGIMITLWVVGLLLYPISRAYYKRRQFDLSLVFKELPPE